MNQQLNEIKAALSKATPGPWTHSRRAYGYVVTDYPLHNTIASVVEYNEDGTAHSNFDNWENNRHLIANAPQWLASLVDKVERLEYAIQIVEADRDNWLQECGKLHRQVEEMQKTLEWYAGDEIAEIVRRYYFGETICEAIGQRAKVTLQSLKGVDSHE